MAVLSKMPGLSVKVVIKSEAAVEYSSAESEVTGSIAGVASAAGKQGEHLWPRTTTYIESSSGTLFQIEATFGPGFQTAYPEYADRDAICVSAYIDGTWVNCKWLKLNQLRKNEFRTFTISDTYSLSANKEDTVQCLFTFAPVSGVDSATKEKIAEDAKIAKSLGEIRVDIHLAKTTNLGDLRISVKQTGEFALAEKAMKGKAISHGTSFPVTGIASAPKAQMMENWTAIGQFVFRYRSRDALREEMILPPPRSPSPAKPDINTMSISELRTFAQNLLHAQRDSRSVKREIDDRATVSCEGRQYKLVKLESGEEAVDLTED